MSANDTKEYVVPLSYRVDTYATVEAFDEDDAATKAEAATRAWANEPNPASLDHWHLILDKPTIGTIEIDRLGIEEEVYP